MPVVVGRRELEQRPELRSASASAGCGSRRCRAPRGSTPSRLEPLGLLERHGRLRAHPARSRLALLEEVVRVAHRSASRLDLVEDRGGDRGLGALATDARPLGARRARPRCRRASKPMSARETSLKTTRSAFLSSSIARLRSSPSSPRSAPKSDEQLAGALARAERARDVGGRRELERPGLVALRPLARRAPRPGGSRRRPRRAARCRRRSSASAASSIASAVGVGITSTPGGGSDGEVRGEQHHLGAAPRAPRRRARRPSGPRSGCRRSAPRRAARACRRR